MNILTKEEFLKGKYMHMIKKGAVFIYPTDTIYGIGCDATNEKAVARIRALKKRRDNPFSVIAPSQEWIKENCEVFGKGIEWLEKLPGPYTLVFKLKIEDCIAKNVNNSSETLGIRIPDTWISEMVKELDMPLVTTSVNEAGKPYMTSLEDGDDNIKNSVDFIIYEGEKKGKPSQIIDVRDGEPVIKR